MRAMNTSQAAVVDVILSNYVRGYSNAEFVATRLLPTANVPTRSTRQLRFGKDGFRRLNTRRAPGAPIVTVQYGYVADPISLQQDALQGMVPVEIGEEAAAVPGVDLGRNAVAMVMDQLDLGLEIDAANLTRAAGTYAASNRVTLSGGSQWHQSTSTPNADVKAGREAVRAQIGRYPNVMVIGPRVFNALTEHAAIKEQFKYTSADSITEAMLARYFGLDEVVVGKGVFLPDGAADSAAATDIWGNDAILAYVPRGTGNYMGPAFGYTYRLTGYPMVEAPWWDRETRSWKYPTVQERRPFVLGADAGFLLQAAVA
jgi:hypothetical protein